MGRLLRLRAVAVRLDVVPSTVLRWGKAGRLDLVRLGREWRITEESLIRLILANDYRPRGLKSLLGPRPAPQEIVAAIRRSLADGDSTDE